MRRAVAVSVSGAILFALLCIASISLLPNPVGAQPVDDPNDPLDGEEVTLLDTDGDDIANRVLIGGITNCTIGADATVTVQRNDDTGEPAGEPVSLANQAPVRITQVGTGIVIVSADLDNLNENLERGVGVVTGSSGITCGDNGGQVEGIAPGPDAECPGARVVNTTAGTGNKQSAIFATTGDFFRVTTALAATGDPQNIFFSVDVNDENDRNVATIDREALGTDSSMVNAGPGRFFLDILAANVDYTIVVEDCGDDDNGGGDDNNGGGDGNDDDGDVDDPDDVVPGTGDDDPLPDTGGAPLLFGAAALVLAAALLARRILAP